MCNKINGTQSFYRPNTKLEFSSSLLFSPFQATGNRTLEISSSSINEPIFEVFPNPLDEGILSGKLTDIGDVKMILKIYDMLGRELFSKEVTLDGGSFLLSIADQHLGTGVYMVVGQTETNLFSKRVVVK